MRKALFFIPLFFACIAGCSQSTEPVATADSFFPISEVSSWQYSTSTAGDIANQIWKVGSEEVVDGISYYSVVISHPGTMLAASTVYFRCNGTILYKKYAGSPEFIIADFSLNKGDAAYWDPYLKVTEKTESIMKFDTGLHGDYQYTITFRKGIGITLSTDSGAVYNQIILLKIEKQGAGIIDLTDNSPKLL